MPGVGERDPSRFRVDHGVEHGEEHLRARELVGKRRLETAQHLRRRLGRFRMDAGSRHHERHDQRGAEAVARHVADHHADTVRSQVEQVVKVPADRLGLTAARGDIHAAGEHAGRGQQFELEVPRQLELPQHPLLSEVAGDEARVLDGRADLVRDRSHQLSVAGGEGVSPLTVGQIDHADRLAARARRGVQHRDREERLAAIVAAFGAAGVRRRRVGRVVAHDPHLAEHERGDRAGVVHFDRLHVLRAHAARRYDAQHPLLGVVHQERRAPGPHHRGHLAQYPICRFVEPDRVSQDLADRVDQVDFLVPLRQLRRDLDGIALGGEHGPDDLGELPTHARAGARGQ